MHRRIVPIALSALVLGATLALGGAMAAAAASGAADWPQYRGPRRDGVSTETGLLRSWPEAGPAVVWRQPIGDGFSGIAAVALLAKVADSYSPTVEAPWSKGARWAGERSAHSAKPNCTSIMSSESSIPRSSNNVVALTAAPRNSER